MLYHPSDSIKLSLEPPLLSLARQSHPLTPLRYISQDGHEISILDADEHFVCVEKPHFLRIDAVNATELTLAKILKEYLIQSDGLDETNSTDPLSNITELKQTHQLDANTSGVFLYAKTKSAAGEASRMFAERKVRKTYLAIVHGHVDVQQLANERSIQQDHGIGDHSPSLRIQAWIQETSQQRCESVAAPDDSSFVPAGKGHPQAASTVMMPLAHLNIFASRMQVTLVRLAPETGRRHQLRVHCASIGHAIVGDWEYETVPTKMLVEDGGRMFLHAFQLEMTFPDRALLDGTRKRNKRGKYVSDHMQPVKRIWRSKIPFQNVLDEQSTAALIKIV